jgi:hypothetical protein
VVGQVEEHFKSETKDYLTTIKRLQEENRKLSASLTAATERDRSAFLKGTRSRVPLTLPFLSLSKMPL